MQKHIVFLGEVDFHALNLPHLLSPEFFSSSFTLWREVYAVLEPQPIEALVVQEAWLLKASEIQPKDFFEFLRDKPIVIIQDSPAEALALKWTKAGADAVWSLEELHALCFATQLKCLCLKAFSKPFRAQQQMRQTVKKSYLALSSKVVATDQQLVNVLQADLAQAYADRLFQLSQENERLQAVASRDFLTGISSRYHFEKVLAMQWAQARRRQRRFAVMLIDIDHFKLINDTYGHAMGDQLLQWVAMRMQQVLREEDCLGRWGGDEFSVMLSEITRSVQAEHVAKRILQALSAPCELNEQLIEITASIGIACFSSRGVADVEQLWEQADKALYQAKSAGRARYQLHRPREQKVPT